MRVETPAPCINVYYNVFNKEDSLEFISLLDKESENDWSEIEWRNSGVGQEGRATEIRTSLSCSLIPLFKPYEQTDVSTFFHSKILNPSLKTINDYKKEHSLTHVGINEPYSVLRYFPHSEYHAHFDHSPESRRVFSTVINLQEPEEGGELEFPNFGVTVKPEAGMVICFPSNFPYLHIAHPVVSGMKHSLVTWWQ
jgi:hypothetical protein